MYGPLKLVAGELGVRFAGICHVLAALCERRPRGALSCRTAPWIHGIGPMAHHWEQLRSFLRGKKVKQVNAFGALVALELSGNASF